MLGGVSPLPPIIANNISGKSEIDDTKKSGKIFGCFVIYFYDSYNI